MFTCNQGVHACTLGVILFWRWKWRHLCLLRFSVAAPCFLRVIVSQSDNREGAYLTVQIVDAPTNAFLSLNVENCVRKIEEQMTICVLSMPRIYHCVFAT